MAVTRSLFVYWKTDAAAAAPAAAAMAAFQQALRQRHADLVTRLYRRVDDAGPAATLMETYARPEGIDAALQAEITDAGACARWCRGPRHVEVFEAWPAEAEAPDTPGAR